MKTFKLQLTHKEIATIEVEAESYEKAVDEAHSMWSEGMIPIYKSDLEIK